MPLEVLASAIRTGTTDGWNYTGVALDYLSSTAAIHFVVVIFIIVVIVVVVVVDIIVGAAGVVYGFLIYIFTINLGPF